MATDRQKIETALNKGNGVLRLGPCWVPRSFCIPGKRLKLHPNDYYAFGGHRGGIDERWFASTTKADNGPETLPDEGLDGHDDPPQARTFCRLRSSRQVPAPRPVAGGAACRRPPSCLITLAGQQAVAESHT